MRRRAKRWRRPPTASCRNTWSASISGADRHGDVTYLRFAFGGRLLGVEAERALDHGILRALWLTPEEIAAEHARHRSPLVMQCVRDYLAGRRFSLDLITHYE